MNKHHTSGRLQDQKEDHDTDQISKDEYNEPKSKKERDQREQESQTVEEIKAMKSKISNLEEKNSHLGHTLQKVLSQKTLSEQ